MEGSLQQPCLRPTISKSPEQWRVMQLRISITLRNPRRYTSGISSPAITDEGYSPVAVTYHNVAQQSLTSYVLGNVIGRTTTWHNGITLSQQRWQIFYRQLEIPQPFILPIPFIRRPLLLSQGYKSDPVLDHTHRRVNLLQDNPLQCIV